MSSVSDRAYFLEQIKEKPMTINEIIEQFGCASNTARSWVKHPDVERVVGSYPPAYVRKDTLVLTKPTKASPKAGKVVVEFDQPPTEQIDEFFHKVLAGEGGMLDFSKEFRDVDSQAKLAILTNKLKSSFILCEYYKHLMIRDGME